MIYETYLTSQVTLTYVYIFSILIRISPEILTDNLDISQKNEFILCSFKAPEALTIIIISLNFISLIYGLIRMFAFKKQCFIFEFFHYIFGLIQIYLCSLSLKQSINNNKTLSICFYAFSFILTGIIILIIPYYFKFKQSSQKFQSINTISNYYSIFNGGYFIILAVFSFLYTRDNVREGLVVLFILNLTRTIFFCWKIHYEDVFIEYCAVLGQIGAWISFIQISLNLLSIMQCSFLLWIYLLFLIISFAKKNSALAFLIELKYSISIKKLKQTLRASINLYQTSYTKLNQSQFIEVLSCLFYIIKSQNIDTTKWRQIKFSENLLSQMYSLITIFFQFQTIKQLPERTYTHSNINLNELYSQKIFKQGNTRIQWSLVWKVIGKIKEIQENQFVQLRRFLIHSFPLLDIKINYRLLYLHFLNANQDKKNFIQAHQACLDYKHLTQKILLEYRININNESKQIQIDERIRQETIFMTRAKINGSGVGSGSLYNRTNLFPALEIQSLKFCLSYAVNHPCSSQFHQFHKQMNLERQIQELFKKLLQIKQKKIATINLNSFSGKDQSIIYGDRNQLFQLLEMQYNLKKKLQQQISKIQLTAGSKIKTLAYLFMFQYYGQNRPNIAWNNLESRRFDDIIFNASINKKQISKFRNNSHHVIQDVRIDTHSLNQNHEDKSMMLFVSGVQSFGKITHFCSNFKQNFQIHNNLQWNQKERNNSKLTIYDFMLPAWVQKHKQTMKQSDIYQQTRPHRGRKYHMVSFQQKNIFEVNFQMHYIIRDMQDLIFALDITYQNVQELLICKQEKIIFQSLKDQKSQGKRKQKQNKYDNSQEKIINRSVSMLNSKANNKTDSCLKQAQINFEEKYTRCQEAIFGQFYKFIKIYANSVTSFSKLNKHIESYEKVQQSEYYQDHKLSKFQKQKQNNFQFPALLQKTINTGNDLKAKEKIIKKSQKLIHEIKMVQYVRNNLFFARELHFFNFPHWAIPPFIICTCMFLKFYSSSQDQYNLNIYQTKLNLLQNFFQLQTHLFFDLTYLKFLNENLKRQQFLENQIVPILMYDIKTQSKRMHQRQYFFQKLMSDEKNQIFDIWFNHLQNISQSIYYSALKYELQTDDFVKMIGFDVSLQDARQNLKVLFTQNISKTKIILAQNNYFQQFKHQYERYIDPNNSEKAIINQIIKFQIKNYQNLLSVYTVILVLLIAISSLGAIIFVWVFLNLRYHISKLTFDCLLFSDKQIIKFKSKISLAYELLENCKQEVPTKIVDKYYKFNSESSSKSIESNQSGNRKQTNINFGSKISHKQQKISITKSKVFKNFLAEIILFGFIVILLQILLILLITNFTSEIARMRKFSQADTQISKMAALSNQVGTEMIYTVESGVQDENSRQQILEYKNIKKFQVLKQLQPNQQKYLKLVYQNMCEQINSQNEQFCSYHEDKVKHTFAQSVSYNLKHLLTLQVHFKSRKYQNQNTFLVTNDHLSNIAERISIINQFTHKILKTGFQNYLSQKESPQIYLNLIILEMALVILILNGFSYFFVYKKLKIYSKQIFSFCDMNQMKQTKAFYCYVNKALQQRIDYVGSGVFN